MIRILQSAVFDANRGPPSVLNSSSPLDLVSTLGAASSAAFSTSASLEGGSGDDSGSFVAAALQFFFPSSSVLLAVNAPTSQERRYCRCYEGIFFGLDLFEPFCATFIFGLCVFFIVRSRVIGAAFDGPLS